jgi:hypothetical protein
MMTLSQKRWVATWLISYYIFKILSFCAKTFHLQEEATDHPSPETSSEAYVPFIVVYWLLN